jgi:GAF domain-containing protein
MTQNVEPGIVSWRQMPGRFWVAATFVLLGIVYAALDMVFVLPYLWPAGHGALVSGEGIYVGSVAGRALLVARPPDLSGEASNSVVAAVAPGSPADLAGIKPGDVILSQHALASGLIVDVASLLDAPASERLRVWREAWQSGLRGPVQLRVAQPGNDGPGVRTVRIERPPVWSTAEPVVREWLKKYLGPATQAVAFIAVAVVLLLLRGDDTTGAIAAMALASCTAAAGGPLLGAERLVPPPLRDVVTMFSWLAVAFAFALTTLAVLCFPRPSPLLARHRWLVAIPFAAVLPIVVLNGATGLYLSGFDAAAATVLYQVRHFNLFWASFAVAGGVNVLALVEAIARYRRNDDENERRRIRLALATTVVGVLAFTLKDGVPASLMLTRGVQFEWPWAIHAALFALIIVPAFVLAYAVAVNRVLGPRLLLRRSLQHALALKTLMALSALPAILLLLALYKQRDRSLAAIVSGAPALYAGLIVLSVAGVRYRDRARQWLDKRFFRQEYDARRILMSLAERVRFETNPRDLTTLVTREVEQALHPRAIGVLVEGLDEGRLMPAAPQGTPMPPLALSSGLVTLLRWSPEPLEVYMNDPRSPVLRLPDEDRAWLEASGAVLLVPMPAQDRSLVGLIVLGEKRSDEPYSSEDRELITTMAGQAGLALDAARLRSRLSGIGEVATRTVTADASIEFVMECPLCGLCHDRDATFCRTDGTTLVRLDGVPPMIDGKYRLDQRLGRGGMGAVYRARDVRLDRDVAVKLVRPDLIGDPEARARFRREAQIVARLSHPGVVTVFDYGTLDAGGAFLVMELVRGRDLRAVLREQRLPLATALSIMSAMCEAVEAAHRAGVLHRDLKPENVLLVSDPRTVAKVLDFGVAKLRLERAEDQEVATRAGFETRLGQIVGTPAYMAPEQLRGGDVDARADVFSLGVIAYEMLTGELPFGAGPLGEVAARQVDGPASFLRADELPPGTATAVLAALSTDRNRRPATPTRFAEMLKAGERLAGAG